MVNEINFQHFFVEIKELAPLYIIANLNPYTMKFYKADKVYFATLYLDQETLEITSTIGEGITGFRELIKACKQSGIKILKFGCSEHNKKVQTIYRYAGAKKVGEKKEYYNDKSTCFTYELDLINSKRIKDL